MKYNQGGSNSSLIVLELKMKNSIFWALLGLFVVSVSPLNAKSNNTDYSGSQALQNIERKVVEYARNVETKSDSEAKNPASVIRSVRKIIEPINDARDLSKLAIWASFVLRDKTLDDYSIFQAIVYPIIKLGKSDDIYARNALIEVFQNVELGGETVFVLDRSFKQRSLKFPSYWVAVRFPRLEFSYPLDWQLASRCIAYRKILSENWHPTNDIVLRVPLKVEFDANLNGDISNFQIIEDPRSILTPAQKRQVGQCIRNAVYSCRSIKGANGDKQIHLVAVFH